MKRLYLSHVIEIYVKIYQSITTHVAINARLTETGYAS
jgi:hypothetical protein